MSLVNGAFRIVSYLFVFFTAVFLIAVGFAGVLTGNKVQFELLPGIDPSSVALTLASLGGTSLVALMLALFNRHKIGKILFLIWNIFVFCLLLCALVRSSYSFTNAEHFRNIVLLLGFSLMALMGSWSVVKLPSR